MLYSTIITCFLLTICISGDELLMSNITTQCENKNLKDELSQLRKKLDTILEENDRSSKSFAAQLKHGLESVQIQLNRIEKTSGKPPLWRLPKNCKEVQMKNSKTGIYHIRPEFAPKSFTVFCDMETKGGGWTSLFNRFDGSQDFYLNWTDYRNGFGNLAREFWLGLENLYFLTGFESNELLVQLTDWENNTVDALYNVLMIRSEEEGYAIEVLGAYNGSAGDSLRYHEGMKFTTPDRDQDLRSYANCATTEKGSWWYNSCSENNLTGRYLKGYVSGRDRWQIMYWKSFRGTNYGLKKARMMVRPTNEVIIQ